MVPITRRSQYYCNQRILIYFMYMYISFTTLHLLQLYIQLYVYLNNFYFLLLQSLFTGNNNIQIRYDLLDCNICICSTTVS